MLGLIFLTTIFISSYSNTIPDCKTSYSINYHYLSSYATNSIGYEASNMNRFLNVSIDYDAPTMFVIHGFKADGSSTINKLIVDALRNLEEDWNIFIVDWNSVEDALECYDITASTSWDVGSQIAEFIEILVNYNKIQLEKLTLVGYGLGAHIAGAAGFNMRGQIPVIVGLDPAKPFFEGSVELRSLSITDANYVQIIHTDGYKFGYETPIGHADFFVNGGMTQPCLYEKLSRDKNWFHCSHDKAMFYYAESITHNNFDAQSCIDSETWIQGACRNNAVAKMGGAHVDTSARGNYYLTTNKIPPYGMGKEGLSPRLSWFDKIEKIAFNILKSILKL